MDMSPQEPKKPIHPASLRYWSGLRTHQRGARQASFPLCAPLWKLTELSVSVIALGPIYHEGCLVGGNIFETLNESVSIS